jgi:hypothetical protein
LGKKFLKRRKKVRGGGGCGDGKERGGIESEIGRKREDW